MNKYELTLPGGLPDELRVSATVLHEAVGALLEGARMATRFAVEGHSVRKGPRPAWLAQTTVSSSGHRSLGSGKVVIESAGASDSSSVSAFFGTWPGEENDAELLEALRAIG